MTKTSHISNKKLLATSLVSVAFLVGANLFITNILATTGEQLRTLETRKKTLVEQNSRIRQKIVSESTLMKVEEKALALGFSTERQTVNLIPPKPVALNQP